MVLYHSPAAFLRLQLTFREIYFSGVLSLVIILVSGLFVGMVLGLQGYVARAGTRSRRFRSSVRESRRQRRDR